MDIEVFPIGGYESIGANMTGLIIDDIGIIIDMGIAVDKFLPFEEKNNIQNLSIEELYRMQAIPDDRIFYEKYKDKVKAIILTHGHLDHIGSVSFLASKYDAPIYCSNYTYHLLKQEEKEEKYVSNDIKKINPNNPISIGENIEIEFINITHSIPNSNMIDIKTDKGHIIFSGDFKFDNFPIIGKRPDYKKLKKIGNEGVKLLIVETTRADEESKTYSEVIEKYMLYDVLNYIESEGIIITTFSSHIARLKEIVDLSYEMNRKPIFVGRSMKKYIDAAYDAKIYNFYEKAEVYGDIKDYAKILENISKKEKSEYLIISTGHQGEPGSVLDKIANDEIKFDLTNTSIIFANNVIPSPINEANRKILEEKLKSKGVHIIKDVHVPGHAKAEDHRKLLKLLNPEYIIPNHGDIIKKAAYYNNIAKENGYTLGKDIFLLGNNQPIKLSF